MFCSTCVPSSVSFQGSLRPSLRVLNRDCMEACSEGFNTGTFPKGLKHQVPTYRGVG